MLKCGLLLLLFSAHGYHALRQNSEKVDTEVSRLASEYGNGFVQASECGGVLEGLAGVINYKWDQNITAYETCVWTVILSKKAKMEIELLDDGFGTTQKIKVLNIKDARVGFDFELDIKGGDRHVYTVDVGTMPNMLPVFQIVFSSSKICSDQSGTGFSLLFKAVGEEYTGLRSYKIFDQAGLTGTIRYPEVGDVYPNWEFVSFTIHPKEGKMVALSIHSYINTDANIHAYSSCSNAAYINLVISEVEYNHDTPVVLFRECRKTTRKTTIYSPYPLVVQYHTATSINSYGNFQLSWKMVELN